MEHITGGAVLDEDVLPGAACTAVLVRGSYSGLGSVCPKGDALALVFCAVHGRQAETAATAADGSAKRKAVGLASSSCRNLQRGTAIY